jgi:hypothetical protein
MRRRAPQSAYPLLSLYRNILRAHQQLPQAHRELGDAYVRNEFRLHRNAAVCARIAEPAFWRALP